jgi:hypothetical protein
MVNRKSQVVLLFAIYDLPFTQGDKLMNPTIEQQVIEAIRILPETKQIQVLSYVKQISQTETHEPQRPPKRKLFAKLEELRAKLPKDAFEGYPTDGSLNHDHYLYGSAKREQE